METTQDKERLGWWCQCGAFFGWQDEVDPCDAIAAHARHLAVDPHGIKAFGPGDWLFFGGLVTFVIVLFAVLLVVKL